MKTIVFFISVVTLAVISTFLAMHSTFLTPFLLKHSVFVISDLKITYKHPFKVNHTLVNDKVKGFCISFAIESSAVLSKFLVYAKVKIPDEVNGDKDFINAVVDGEKALEGKQNNMILAMIIDILLRFCTFRDKPCIESVSFPVPKVSSKIMLYLKGVS